MTGVSTRADARRVVLGTARTVLTTGLDSDAEALADLHSDAETMRFVRNGRPESRAKVEELVRSYLLQQSTRTWAKWRVTDSDGRPIGRAGFGGKDDIRGISYLIARPLWGQGLATEVCEALIEWHLSNAPHAQLRGLVVPGNDASIRVLEKVGFQKAGAEDYAGTLCWNYTCPTDN